MLSEQAFFRKKVYVSKIKFWFAFEFPATDVYICTYITLPCEYIAASKPSIVILIYLAQLHLRPRRCHLFYIAIKIIFVSKLI